MQEEDIVEGEVKYYVFVKNGYHHFAPQYISAGMTTVDWIFPVPEANAIGTLDGQSNGVVFIKFGEYGKDHECKVVAKNCGEKSISDNSYYRFSPNFADDMIVYTKLEDVVIVDVTGGKAFCGKRILSDVKIKNGEALFVDGDSYKHTHEMMAISFLNPQNNLLAVVNSLYVYNEGYNKYEWTDFLQVVRREGEQLVNTAWITHIGRIENSRENFLLYQTWFVHNRTLLVYDRAKHLMLCTDGYVSVSHPFAEVFNANAGRISRVMGFVLHPNLPFGIMIEEGALKNQSIVLLRWDISDRKKRKQGKQVVSYTIELQPLATLFGLKSVMFVYQSFSPNGDWYVVGVGCLEPGKTRFNPHFIAIPVTAVDKNRSSFLGMDKLVVLGQVAYVTSIAWTSEPTSYVVSNGDLLHKWDLDELPNARVFVVREEGVDKKVSIFRRIVRWLLGLWK